MKKISIMFLSIVIVALIMVFFNSQTVDASTESVQKEITEMENLSLPSEDLYKYKDWKQTTIDYLNYVLDPDNVYEEDGVIKKIARFSSATGVNNYFNESGNECWSIPSYIGMGDDSRFGEGINVIAAITSGALVGLDMTNYEINGVSRNYVKMMVEYYQSGNGQNVVLNGGSGGTTGSTFWYELLPGCLFCILASQYDSEAYYMYDIVTESARQWYKAVVEMGGSSADFYHTAFNLETMTPYDNGKWYEPDAAAGIAYILYAAYSLNTLEGHNTYATDKEIENFRQGAIWAMDYLERLDSSPFYEVLTFLAPYLAARLNSEQNTNYDVQKMIEWTLDGSSSVRSGWGMITENWGDHYTQGIMGSLTDGSGYAFLMNTFDACLGFLPLVKYDTRFASNIAKWILCMSQGAQSFYPSEYEVEGTVNTYGDYKVYNGVNQSGKWIAQDDEKATFIAYEGLRKYQKSVIYKGDSRTTSVNKNITPYASGDAFTYNWGGYTDYGLYGSSHVGLLGASISETNVKMILRTDLNVLDIFNFSDGLEYYMYYNPYNESKTVNITFNNSTSKAYNTITKEYIKLTKVRDNTYSFTMEANETMILCIMDSSDTVTKTDSTYKVNDTIVIKERGSIELSLYNENKTKINKSDSVSGTIYANIEALVSTSSTIESITLSYSGKTIYSGNKAPDGLYEIDTNDLKNGKGTMTVTMTLSGGAIEKSSISLQVLNVVKDSAIEYESFSALASVWNKETTDWKTLYPNSDHNSIVTSDSNSFTITSTGNKLWGFATSELFYLDFTRSPILEIDVGSCSDEFAIKVYVEGMDEPTGEYVLRDTDVTGVYTIDIKEEILNENRSIELDGAYLSSIKIIPTGNEGASVTINSISVYHMYKTPNLEEPSTYEWERDYNSAWMSLWYDSSSVGAEGSPNFVYTNHNSVLIESDNEKEGIASPKINTDLKQNPVFEVSISKLTGKYFAAIRFEGDDNLYILEDNISSSATKTFDIQKLLRANYDDYSNTGIMNIQIIIGATEGSSVEIKSVNAYYRLPQWGSTISGDSFYDFIKETGVAASGSYTIDSSNRCVILNEGDIAKETVIAGISNKMSINFDYNPEMEIIVRATTSTYRLTITDNDGNQYILRDWSSDVSRNAIKINLNEQLLALNGKTLYGQKNVYLNIEVRGGKNTATIQKISTYYTVVPVEFGNTYTTEILSWYKDESNPSTTINSDGKVSMSELKAYSMGITSPSITVDNTLNPIIILDVDSISSDAYYYVIMHINGKDVKLIDESDTVGLTTLYLLDYVSVEELTNPFTIEIYASGTLFNFVINSIEFIYKLSGITDFVEDSDYTVTWKGNSSTSKYHVEITKTNGDLLHSFNTTNSSFSLNDYAFEDGIYYVYITAKANGFKDSDVVKNSIKVGNVESIKLGKPMNFKFDGTNISFDAVDNASSYKYSIYDVDDNILIKTGYLTNNFYDLLDSGMTSFNYKLVINAVGDNLIYLDGEEISFEFYANVISKFTPKSFTSMSAVNNKAFAVLSDDGYAVVQVPDHNNWGNIASVAFELNFDNTPILYIDFDENSYGGYYLQIEIDGTTYYLADNTFVFDDIYLDINKTLVSRKDGINEALTGTHKVKILFGCTGDTITDDPLVNINSSNVYELTLGKGTKIVGELSKTTITVSENNVVSWLPIENATSYIFVVKNEFGTLIDTTVNTTTYDLSILKREGEYSIEIIATGSGYYNSETATTNFTVKLSEENDATSEEEKKGCSSSISLIYLLPAAMMISQLCYYRRKEDESSYTC